MNTVESSVLVDRKYPSIELRRLRLDDADEYFDLFDANREFIAQYDPRLAASFHTIGQVAEQLAPYNARHRFHFGIMHDEELIGSTALFRINDAQTEIAYWIDRDHAGLGLGRHATRLTVNYAFTEVGARQVDAYIAPTNIASIRTVEGLGFVHTKSLEEDVVYSLAR